jgi:pimeloyl-ACP methyl ester carboxylesterase
VAVNLPGFFGSDKPSVVWGTSEYAVFLKDFLTKLNIDNPILIGHSFGGAVALRYASRNPVRKLILVGAAIVRERNSKTVIYYFGAKIFKTLFPFLAKKLRKSFYSKIGALDYLESGHMSDIYQKVIREDSQSYLKNLGETPVSLIWGERDLSTPLRQAHIINSQLPSSQLFILKDAGHYSFLDKREEFQKIFSTETL